jgi:hypothetical protein
MLKFIGAWADEQNIPVYLETDEPHLRTFYSRPEHSFACHHDYVVKCGKAEFAPNYSMLRMPNRGVDARRPVAAERQGRLTQILFWLIIFFSLLFIWR